MLALQSPLSPSGGKVAADEVASGRADTYPRLRLRALDLFCGAGGATKGLQLAGFHVTGIDIKPQPRYCGDAFIRADALLPPVDLRAFDFIWASPPCQRYIRSGTVNKDRHPDLVGPVRDMLVSSGVQFVIENVPGAPLRADLILCGTMFGLGVRRHRWFESSGWLSPWVPATCDHGRPITGVYGNAHGKRGAWPGMLPSDAETWSREMGIDWMAPADLALAIPPAYAEFIGRAAMRHLAHVPAVALPGNATGRLPSHSLPGAEGGFIADQEVNMRARFHGPEDGRGDVAWKETRSISL
jgi:DNA (cytosine-5)-methyltransferase 1